MNLLLTVLVLNKIEHFLIKKWYTHSTNILHVFASLYTFLDNHNIYQLARKAKQIFTVRDTVISITLKYLFPKQYLHSYKPQLVYVYMWYQVVKDLICQQRNQNETPTLQVLQYRNSNILGSINYLSYHGEDQIKNSIDTVNPMISTN